MNEFSTVLLAALPVFAVAGAGVAMRLMNWLTAEADASLLRITIYVLIPCLILNTILGNAALSRLENILVPPLLGFATVLAGLLVARIFRRWSGLTEDHSRRTFSFMVAIYNYGYVPIPLAMALFDSKTVGVLFVFMTGVEAAMWTVGLSVLRGETGRMQWRRMINPPSIAIVVALVLNASGLERMLPSSALAAGNACLKAAQMLGQCAIPLGLVLIGATIADHRKSLALTHESRSTILACALRLGVLPVLFLAGAKYLPLSLEMKHILILEAAMPAAVFPIVMTRHYGGDSATALRIVVATSLLGFLTIPLWIRFGMKLLGS